LHESVFGSAVILSVVADAIDVIGIIVHRPIRVVFEMIIIPGFRQLFRWWYVVRHIVSRGAARAKYQFFSTRVASVNGRERI
jgi:hypothetical protein